MLFVTVCSHQRQLRGLLQSRVWQRWRLSTYAGGGPATFLSKQIRSSEKDPEFRHVARGQHSPFKHVHIVWLHTFFFEVEVSNFGLESCIFDIRLTFVIATSSTSLPTKQRHRALKTQPSESDCDVKQLFRTVGFGLSVARTPAPVEVAMHHGAGPQNTRPSISIPISPGTTPSMTKSTTFGLRRPESFCTSKCGSVASCSAMYTMAMWKLKRLG